jgi:hypothetical protein
MPCPRSIVDLRSTANLRLCVALLAGVSLVPSSYAAAAQPSEQRFVIPEVDEPPRLEDFLTDAPAVPALRLDTFSSGNPATAIPQPSEPLRICHATVRPCTWFLCLDSASQKIRAHLTKREQTPADDLVGVVLDTFHDCRRANLFLANPRGIQRDAMLTEGQVEDLSFDTLWESRGQLTPNSYMVWMAIPFKSLRFASGSDSATSRRRSANAVSKHLWLGSRSSRASERSERATRTERAWRSSARESVSGGLAGRSPQTKLVRPARLERATSWFVVVTRRFTESDS